jgi:hypothetical protein
MDQHLISTLGSLHRADLDNVADVSKVNYASIFKVKVRLILMYINMGILVQQTHEERLRSGATYKLTGTLDRKCYKTLPL